MPYGQVQPIDSGLPYNPYTGQQGLGGYGPVPYNQYYGPPTNNGWIEEPEELEEADAVTVNESRISGSPKRSPKRTSVVGTSPRARFLRTQA